MENENLTIEEIEEPVKEKRRTAKKKTFKNNDYIQCHSVISGGLNIFCKNSGNYYEFRNYGSYGEMEYRDLVALIRRRSEHIFLPRIVVDDEDFVAEFPQVAKLYESTYSINDLKAILRLPVDRMEKAIEDLPSSAKDTIRSLAATDIANGKIDSVKKIRVLTRVFDSDFNLFSELFNK